MHRRNSNYRAFSRLGQVVSHLFSIRLRDKQITIYVFREITGYDTFCPKRPRVFNNITGLTFIFDGRGPWYRGGSWGGSKGPHRDGTDYTSTLVYHRISPCQELFATRLRSAPPNRGRAGRRAASASAASCRIKPGLRPVALTFRSAFISLRALRIEQFTLVDLLPQPVYSRLVVLRGSQRRPTTRRRP